MVYNSYILIKDNLFLLNLFKYLIKFSMLEYV
jgi:hypothetical protein